MRQVFIIVVIGVFIAGGFGCSRNNANVAETNNANTVTESPFANFTDADAALAEGNRLLDENQTEMAIEAYRQAVKLNLDLPEPHFKLGIAYALLDMQMAQSGTVTEPETNANGKKNVITKTRSEREFERAVETYKKWLKTNPDDDTAHFNLARTYNKLGRDEEAEKEFSQTVKLKPDDTEYQTELGAILIKLAQYREAIAPLKKAVELDALNERAAGLLEDAEAGRQRLDYVSPKKDANQSNANMAANSNANVNANSNSNSAPKPPTGNTAKPRKDEPVDKRPRLVGNKPN